MEGRSSVALCFLTIPLVWLAPADWPRPARLGLNTPGTTGLVLLVIAILRGDGIGAGVRERSAVQFGAGLGRAFHAAIALTTITVAVVVVRGVLKAEPLPRTVFTIWCLSPLLALLPHRFELLRGTQGAIGCLGVLLLIAGAVAEKWPWSLFYLYGLTSIASGSIAKLNPQALPSPEPPSEPDPAHDVEAPGNLKAEDPDPESGSGSQERTSERLSP